VRYVFKKEKLLIGFREKNGRYLADINACSVLHPSIGQKIPLLRDFLLSLEGYLAIPQLEIAVGDDETAIIIRHMNPLSALDLERIVTFGLSQNYKIYLQPGAADSVHLVSPEAGSPMLHYSLPDHQIEMRFAPTDFTQINAQINVKMINLAIELLAPRLDEIMLDLFCGIGNFSLPLARYCKKVIGVEGSDLMVARGYQNAQHNGIENVEFHCRDLTTTQNNDDWLQQCAGILLDPPRTGAWEVIQSLPKLAALSRIVYVSCNPATLARDAGYLCQNGFKLVKVGVLDMFPHTSHVESIALFVRD
jgi:23S rRNA (uracil1939-C5)-methyltransferase